MPGLSMQQIDRKTAVKGFAAALVDVGWLADDVCPYGVRIERFTEHNGKSAKKRLETARRVAKHRAGSADVTSDDPNGNAESVTGALAREEKRREERIEARANADPRAEDPEPEGHKPSAAGLACRAMRSAGMAGVNPGDPRLLALLEQGATREELESVAADAVARGKGFAWALKALEGRRADAAAIALAPKLENRAGEAAAAQSVAYLADQAAAAAAARTPEAQAARRAALAKLGRAAG